MGHSKIDDILIVEIGFKTSPSDPCLYIKRKGNVVMIITPYVYGLLFAPSDLEAIMWMKCELSKRFEMKDLSETKPCIGLEISRDRSVGTLTISQSKYATEVLIRFNTFRCQTCATPMEQSTHVPRVVENDKGLADSLCNAPYRPTIGCLMFLMVSTRQYLAFVFGRLSQHCADLRESH